MPAPLRVGLVGAGPWATIFTAPLLARGPHCTLSAVWARRPELAETLAARHGSLAVGSFEELLDTCEAVAFAVPPDVQADLAGRAARAGRAVLLDKPIGIELAQAEELADVITGSGVVSQMVLTNRYRPTMRAFLDEASRFGATGGRVTFLGGGSLPGGTFATPWRVEQGGLLDLGPHVLDALEATLGPIEDLVAVGDRLGVVGLSCTHEGGAFSQAALSVTTPVEPSGLVIELFGPQGRIELDTAAGDAAHSSRDVGAAMATLTAELAAAVRSGVPHPLDVRHGLHLQRLIDRATTQLATSR